MKVSQFYWLPILGSILGVTTVILCYFITILNGYFKPIFPVISYTAMFPPASLIFGVGISFASIPLVLSILLWKFDSDNFIESAFGKEEDSYEIRHSSNPSKTYQRVKFLNKVALAFASLGIITLIILGQANVSLWKYWWKLIYNWILGFNQRIPRNPYYISLHSIFFAYDLFHYDSNHKMESVLPSFSSKVILRKFDSVNCRLVIILDIRFTSSYDLSKSK